MLRDQHLGRLLDAGGGEGFLSSYLMNRRPVDEAVVYDHDPCVLAGVPAPITTVCGRLEELDGSHGSFSTILLRQVLHYFATPQPVLRRIAQRLLPHGQLYVGQIIATDEPAAHWLGENAFWISPPRQRVWTIDDLLTTFSGAKLTMERAVVVPHWQRLHNVVYVEDSNRFLRIASADAGEERGVFARVLFVHALLRRAHS
jgi:hypothetical protein